jgi:hypothetical protein
MMMNREIAKLRGGRRLDLELTADGSLVAVIDGNEVARSADRKVAISWESFIK